MRLNCKVIKKVAASHFYINPPFLGLSPFLAKILIAQVTQFLEGPIPL